MIKPTKISKISKMDKKQQQKLIRQNIICYFLAMAQGHQATQHLQQQLIMHPYFNPILLFKKFAQHEQISKKKYIHYLVDKVKITSTSAIQTYMKKHSLGIKFDCEQFIESILPYSPDTLRNSSATIVWQVTSTPILKKAILSIFNQIIKLQISSILNISSFRKAIPYTWNQLKNFILTDLKHINPKLLQKQFNIITIRKWMEQWIYIHEKDILNIMRWMKGGTQQHIYHNYMNIYADDVICVCRWMLNSNIKLKKPRQKQKNQTIILNHKSKPLSRLQSQLYARKMSFIQSEGHSPSTLSQRSTYHNGKSSQSKLTVQKRSASLKLDYPPHSPTPTNKLINSYLSSLNQKAKCLLYQYIYTILTGQNSLTMRRSTLKSFINKIKQLIQSEIINKKNHMTKLTKIISFIYKNTHLLNIYKKFMLDCLAYLSIQNQVIMSIFTNNNNASNLLQNQNQITTNNNNPQQPQINHKLLKKQIADMLKDYCLTKCKLIRISQQILSTNISQHLFKILDYNNFNSLHKQNFVSIMNQMNIEFRQGDPDILVRHFGDGHVVTNTSFLRVFKIQGV